MRPEFYGVPAEKQTEWARHPQMMNKLQEQRQEMKEKQTHLRVSESLSAGVPGGVCRF